jgi:hypothetical protein
VVLEDKDRFLFIEAANEDATFVDHVYQLQNGATVTVRRSSEQVVEVEQPIRDWRKNRAKLRDPR